MKLSTLQARISRANFRHCKALDIIKDFANMENKKTYQVFADIIRPCTTSGRGRFTTNLDYTADVCRLLDQLKIKYISGNDSPRGGKTGNCIKILTKIDRSC